MKKINVIITTLFLSLATAKAQEVSIIGHGFSKHLQNYNHNERNYGIGLRYEKGEYALQVGDYYNSLRKNSFYVGMDWSPIHTNITGCLNFESGLYAGGATGYSYKITPIAGVQAAFKCKNVFIRVRAMPDVFYHSKAVGAIEFGFVLSRF
jgi:hypothetical protein